MTTPALLLKVVFTCTIVSLAGCATNRAGSCETTDRFSTLRDDLFSNSPDDTRASLKGILKDPDSTSHDRALAIRLLVEEDFRKHGLPEDAVACLRQIIGRPVSAKDMTIQSDWAYAGAFPLDDIEGIDGSEYMFKPAAEDDIALLMFSIKLAERLPLGHFEEMLAGERPPKSIPVTAAYFDAIPIGFIMTKDRWLNFETDEWNPGRP